MLGVARVINVDVADCLVEGLVDVADCLVDVPDCLVDVPDASRKQFLCSGRYEHATRNLQTPQLQTWGAVLSTTVSATAGLLGPAPAEIKSVNIHNCDLQNSNPRSSDLQSRNLHNINVPNPNRHTKLHKLIYNTHGSKLYNSNLRSSITLSYNQQSSKLQSSNRQSSNLQSPNHKSTENQSSKLQGSNLQSTRLVSANKQGCNTKTSIRQSPNVVSSNNGSSNLQSPTPKIQQPELPPAELQPPEG